MRTKPVSCTRNASRAAVHGEKNVRNALALAALVMCGFGVYYTIIELQTSRWPSVEGRVTATRIAEIPGKDDWGGTDIQPEVTYAYSVKGVDYESERFGPHLSFADMSRPCARRKIAEYPVGSEVDVYYDPQDPSSAVLEAHVSRGTFITFGVAGFLAAVATGIHLHARWHREQKKIQRKKASAERKEERRRKNG